MLIVKTGPHPRKPLRLKLQKLKSGLDNSQQVHYVKCSLHCMLVPSTGQKDKVQLVFCCMLLKAKVGFEVLIFGFVPVGCASVTNAGFFLYIDNLFIWV